MLYLFCLYHKTGRDLSGHNLALSIPNPCQLSIWMLSRPRPANAAVDENHENRLAGTHKTPSVKRPLESVENLPTITPLTARKGLRDVTNSARKWDNVSQNTSVRRPSKLSKVTNEEDIPEPEFAPVLSVEEENKLFMGIQHLF